MKTIKAIVFGALVLVCTISTIMAFLFVCATDVSKIGEFLKWVSIDIAILVASGYAIKFLYARWYK